MKWIRLGIIFFALAFLISFVLVPLYNVFLGDATAAQWAVQVMREIRFESFNYWKSLATFYMGLWCGRGILWALATAPVKHEKK